MAGGSGMPKKDNNTLENYLNSIGRRLDNISSLQKDIRKGIRELLLLLVLCPIIIVGIFGYCCYTIQDNVNKQTKALEENTQKTCDKIDKTMEKI